MPPLCPLFCVVGGGHSKQLPLSVRSDQMSVLGPLSAARLRGGPQQAPGLRDDWEWVSWLNSWGESVEEYGDCRGGALVFPADQKEKRITFYIHNATYA